MDWQFNGLPLHILFIHVVVVLVPLAALAATMTAVWPAARRRIGIVAPILALAALVMVPITVEAGEWLAQRVAATPLLGTHMDLARILLPWAIALFALTTIQWGWHRFVATPDARWSGLLRSAVTRTAITTVISVLVVLVSLAATVAVVAIGESGTRAVWLNSFS
ncbi:hypothetical protein D6T64_09690 [Cryobacterium melibiosiphilum]|uniref:Uncharacterized protein n=1 Tax=Cryobacterium melibiosiphilum TaxID=995039 RepID=A0A3A5MHZ8_9MICO|nr:hypothetical protein D6T64_09690 [Cryobacterium melibiosiphilum]